MNSARKATKTLTGDPSWLPIACANCGSENNRVYVKQIRQAIQIMATQCIGCGHASSVSFGRLDGTITGVTGS